MIFFKILNFKIIL